LFSVQLPEKQLVQQFNVDARIWILFFHNLEGYADFVTILLNEFHWIAFEFFLATH
jgi:hypothetical protein